MKILHIIVGLGVGGAELMLKRLAESHRNTIYEHKIISLTTVGKVGLELRKLGVDVRSLEMGSVLDVPRVLWKLSRIIKLETPGIVQTWMYHADLLGGLAARFAGNRRIVWGIRTTDVQAGGVRATTLVRKVCAWLSGKIPHTIVCAADASRRAHIAVGYDATRMTVVPNGFDLTRLVATPEQRVGLRQLCGFDDTHVVVGTLGRFNPAKDHANFVRAAGLVAQRHPEVRFLMVGRELTSDNAVLMHWIEQTGCADRFVLLGERADVAVCLSAMDIFGLSSRTEGFPNVVGEAMAMGVPCVVTDVGDAAMLVADTGVVVPKEDSSALALGLGQLLTLDADVLHAQGQMARQRIVAEFTMMRARDRFEAIYQRVANEGIH